MQTYYATGQYKYIAESFANGAITKSEQTGNISEFIYADSMEDAHKIAEGIFSRYQRYGGAFDCIIVDATPAAETEIAVAVASNEIVTIKRNAAGQLSAWSNGENMGWVFSADRTPEDALSVATNSIRGWAGLAAGAAIADKAA